LEAVTFATNLDSDPGVELIMPVFQQQDLRFMILENANNSLEADAQWHIEYKDSSSGHTLSVVAGDLDNDGAMEIVRTNSMNWPAVNIGTNLQILKNIGEDQYKPINEVVPIQDYAVAVASLEIANMDGGFPELYLLDNQGIVLVMKHNGDLTTINENNFTPIFDISSMAENLRGISIGDQDRDGLPNIYFGGSNQQVIYDLEYTGGDVTNPDNYTFDIVWDLAFPIGWGAFTRLGVGNVKLGNEYGQSDDLDGDGYPELVFITGDHYVGTNVPVLVVFENTAEPSGVDFVRELPTGFGLFQNYPNPFNPVTEIAYELAKEGPVRLEVFSLRGEHVATLIDEIQNAGTHQVRFDASLLSSGVYIYRLITKDVIRQRKMLLLK